MYVYVLGPLALHGALPSEYATGTLGEVLARSRGAMRSRARRTPGRGTLYMKGSMVYMKGVYGIHEGGSMVYMKGVYGIHEGGLWYTCRGVYGIHEGGIEFHKLQS